MMDPGNGGPRFVSFGQPPGIDLEAVRKTLKRRVMFVLVGVAIVIVGLQIDAVALGWPLWSSTVAWILGAAVASVGALGPAGGMGCLSQLLLVVLLSSLVCNATATDHPGTHVLGFATLLAIISAALLRRRRASIMARVPTARGVAGEGVIDVEAREKPGKDPGRA